MDGINKKDLKWRIICAGVDSLIEKKGLHEDDVVLWMDWQSIAQDDKEAKGKGVKSLITYATQCQYMLVPLDEKELDQWYAGKYPFYIPDYGDRAWVSCAQLLPGSTV